MIIGRISRLFGALALLLLGGCASVMRAPCDEPRISNRWAPAAYLVKLPLAVDGERVDVAKAQDLESLLELQAIALTSEVGESHLTLLDARQSRECDIADVYDAVISKRSGLFWRRVIHSAVFLWGDVHERNGELFLKMYMRVYWNGREGTARVVYPGTAGEPPLEFTGRFPASTIAFPRRKLESATLGRLAERLDRMHARASPDPDAPKVKLPHRFVVSSSGDRWLRVTATEGPDAWLPREDLAALAPDLLPELEFVRAVMAYLHFKVSGSVQSARTSLEALERFDRQYAQAWQPSVLLPLAIGDVIAGSVGQAHEDEKGVLSHRSTLRTWFSALWGTKTLGAELKGLKADALELPEFGYARAQVRTPADSDILTLSALGRIPGCCAGQGDPRRIAEITSALESARQIDAANPSVADNLLNWYRLLRRLDAAVLPFPAQELDRRASALESALSPP